jgi:hypothetical protein
MKLLARRGDSQDFDDNSSLLVSGRLQSIDAIGIAMFLEEAFGINFAETGLIRSQWIAFKPFLSLLPHQRDLRLSPSNLTSLYRLRYRMNFSRRSLH